MAAEYFLYTTDYNNTLVDRSDTSFAPLPPNTGEILIDYFIPEIQPLYLYRESGSTIVVNDDVTIVNYLNSIKPAVKPDDYVEYENFTGYTASTKNVINFNEYNNSTPSTGDLWFTGNSLTFNNGSKSFNLTPTYLSSPNYITVDKNGYGDYTSLYAAINSIPSGSTDPYIIDFVPETYIETNPVVIPSNVLILFNNSILYYVGVTGDCIILNNNQRASLRSGYLLTSTGHTGALVKTKDSNNILLENIFFLEGNIGIQSESTITGQSTIYLNTCKFFEEISIGVDCINKKDFTLLDVENNAKIGHRFFNSEKVIINGGGLRNNEIVAISGNSSTILINSLTIQDSYDAIHLISGSTLNSSSLIVEDSERYDIWQQDNNSIVDITNSKLSQYKLNILNWDKFNADYDNDTEYERAYHYNKDVHFGSPENPREIVGGEGNSIGRDTLVYTYNASTSGYTNVSDLVCTDASTGTTTQFPNDTPDNALYISSNIITRDGDYYKHYGLRTGLVDLGAKSTGDYVYEYWDGSEWKEFDRMITLRESPYTSFGSEVVDYTGSTPVILQVRYDSGIFSDWTKNDPISSGTDRYWIRIRITATIDASFINYSLKLHTNRTEINGDGFMEYFGNARPVKKLDLQYNSFAPAINSPTDENLFYSKGLYAGRVQNLFNFNKKDSVGYLAFLPYDIDTSSDLVFKIAYTVDDSSAGNIYFGLNWGVISSDDEIFFSEASAPISASTENDVTGVVPVLANTQNKIKNFNISNVKIPDAIAQRQDGTTDMVVFTLYRDGTDTLDTYNGDVAVIDIAVYYKAWRDGGHIDLL